MTDYYPDSVDQVVIGVLTLTHVAYAGDRIITPEGNKMVVPRYVANTTKPVGARHNHKAWEIVVGLEEDIKAALRDTNYIDDDAANTVLSTFSIKWRAHLADLTEKTKTDTYVTTYVSDYTHRVVNDDINAKQLHELTLLCIGGKTDGTWA